MNQNPRTEEVQRLLLDLPLERRVEMQKRIFDAGVAALDNGGGGMHRGSGPDGSCYCPPPTSCGTDAIRSFQQSYPWEIWCKMRQVNIDPVLYGATAEDRDSDYSSLSNFGQLLQAIELMELGAQKLDDKNTQTSAGANLIIPIPSGAVPAVPFPQPHAGVGLFITWSMEYDSSQPLDVTLETRGVRSLFEETLPNRIVDFQIAPKTNGGSIYLPYAYRSNRGMDAAAVQIGKPTIDEEPPGVNGEVELSGLVPNMTWNVYVLGPFNTWTRDYVAHCAQRAFLAIGGK